MTIPHPTDKLIITNHARTRYQERIRAGADDNDIYQAWLRTKPASKKLIKWLRQNSRSHNNLIRQNPDSTYKYWTANKSKTLFVTEQTDYHEHMLMTVKNRIKDITTPLTTTLINAIATDLAEKTGTKNSHQAMEQAWLTHKEHNTIIAVITLNEDSTELSIKVEYKNCSHAYFIFQYDISNPHTDFKDAINAIIMEVEKYKCT